MRPNAYTTLMSATDLAQHSNDADWVVIDCRHDLAAPQAGQAAYDAGHIPQARFANLDRDLSGVKTAADGHFRGRHPLPERAALVSSLRALGVNENSQVIAYDAHGGMFAARLWWLLRWLGHPAVAVLDGGLAAWQALGSPLSTEVPSVKAGNLHDHPSLVTTISAAEILSDLPHPSRTIIDARAPDRFRGENETMDPVGGHIPGARNRFFKDNLQADGRFKAPDALRAELTTLIDTPTSAVMQCGSGVTACHNLLALEVAGLPGAALYPGSWSEWCADPTRPIER
ncbi:MAG: sulfurtransferase [Pseudomonadota bacterium]